MNLFKAWRKAVGLTREEASVTLGIRNRTTLHRYRHGGTPEAEVILKMICLAYEHSEEAGTEFVDYIRVHVVAPPTVENPVPTRAREAKQPVKLKGAALLMASLAKAQARKQAEG